MQRKLGKLAGAGAALALLVTPTAAMAASRTTVPATSTQSATNAWTTLSAMSSASSSTASVAAAQGDFGYRGNGIPLPVLAVWAATLGLFIWILVHDDDDGGFGISPG